MSASFATAKDEPAFMTCAETVSPISAPGTNPDAAIYYLARMLYAGEDEYFKGDVVVFIDG